MGDIGGCLPCSNSTSTPSCSNSCEILFDRNLIFRLAATAAVTASVLFFLICCWVAYKKARRRRMNALDATQLQTASRPRQTNNNNRSNNNCDLQAVPISFDFLSDEAYSVEGSDVTTCSICLTDFANGEKIRRLPCSSHHVFHVSCIDSWLKRRAQCPLCKKDVIERSPSHTPDEASVLPPPPVVSSSMPRSVSSDAVVISVSSSEAEHPSNHIQHIGSSNRS
mmetsp:Transcript_4794/g.7456  ORF Transcript_4794/g.7456 Transcript_4794/m.7456 type:complete len:224 (+) Transcript_4794:198-869(+)